MGTFTDRNVDHRHAIEVINMKFEFDIENSFTTSIGALEEKNIRLKVISLYFGTPSVLLFNLSDFQFEL